MPKERGKQFSSCPAGKEATALACLPLLVGEMDLLTHANAASALCGASFELLSDKFSPISRYLQTSSTDNGRSRWISVGRRSTCLSRSG